MPATVVQPAPVDTIPGAPDPNDQPPAGATDGRPMGELTREALGAPAVPQAEVSADVTRRYFGSGPWAAIANAAASRSRCTGLTATELQAMVLTTIFRESSGATSPSGAPAPMTLSRYDEWSGIRAENNNINANYGLYAFRDPYTIFKRAFWHPGIGIWQYDSAGVGAPYTAAERIDTNFLAPVVAQLMATRYCNSSQTTEAGKRYSAWADWSLSCNDPNASQPNAAYCESIYQGLMQTGFGNVTQVAMSPTGGAQKRTCSLSGASSSVTCWYIDPSQAQGSTWWATATPLDGGAPNRDSSPRTPIAAPFYVIKSGGTEQRYWLRQDTGYSSDITGVRQLGKNARPKTNQPGSGISWAAGAGLCDRVTLRGSCDPNSAPAGVSRTAFSATAGYRVTTLDANGDGKGDALFYAPGTAVDYLWLGLGSGQFNKIALPRINDNYAVVAADVDGDGRDDLLFNQQQRGIVSIWRSTGSGTFRSSEHRIPPGTRIAPFKGLGGRLDQLLMYAPGPSPDSIWTWNGSGFSTQRQSIGTGYLVRVGDFDGNGREDILFYAAGTAADYIWFHSVSGSRTIKSYRVNSSYRPSVGNFDGDRATDILWYATGGTPDYVWFGGPNANFAQPSFAVGGNYQPVVADLPNTGRDAVYWFAPGTSPDLFSRWNSARGLSTSSITLNGTEQPTVGSFSAGGGDGIIWYSPGSQPHWIWWQ